MLIIKLLLYFPFADRRACKAKLRCYCLYDEAFSSIQFWNNLKMFLTAFLVSLTLTYSYYWSWSLWIGFIFFSSRFRWEHKGRIVSEILTGTSLALTSWTRGKFIFESNESMILMTLSSRRISVIFTTYPLLMLAK